MLSKEEEKALLTKTIARLPESYLKDILVEETRAIEMAIESDLCYLGLQKGWDQQRETHEKIVKEIKKAQSHLDELILEVNRLERQAKQARENLLESQRTAQQIANIRIK